MRCTSRFSHSTTTLLSLSLVLVFGCGDKDDDTSAGTDSSSPPNTAPIAVDDSATTWSGLQVEVDVLDNDDDDDDDTLEITEVTQAENGFVEIDSSGTDSVLYTPTAAFVGVDSFTYTVNDGNGGTDTATVAVNVTDAPTLVITSPKEGETVAGSEITIAFQVDGCNVSYPSSDADGCHLHKYLDDVGYADKNGDGFGQYEVGAFTISPVEVGDHSFMLYLIANNGSDAPFSPLIEDTVTFTVGPTDEGKSKPVK